MHTRYSGNFISCSTVTAPCAATDLTFEVGAGDAFVQPPGTAHQIRNTSATEDLIYYVIADNPISDPVYYPDSDKWAIRPPGKLGRLTETEYYDGEE